MRLAIGEVARIQFVVDEVVIPLARVAVSTRSACGADAEQASGIARLLAELRTAIGSAELAASSLAAAAEVRVFHRTTDPKSGSVRSDSIATLPGRYRWPFQGPSPKQLATAGYAAVHDDGSVTFFAPDPRVLASSEFVESHCFQLKSSPTDSNHVGLAFTPLRGGKATDIKGTVWLERLTAQPRALEALYVRTPRPEFDEQASAVVRFARLGDGRWIVASWAIRTPVMITERRSGSRVGAIRAPSEDRVEVAELQEEGGFVEFGDGRFSPLGAISVAMRTTGAPSGEVKLVLSGTGRRVSTNGGKLVNVRDVSPGAYSLLAYASSGPGRETSATLARFEVAEGRTTNVQLDWRTDTQLVSSLCAAPKRPGSSTALLLVFLDSTSGRPPRDVTARLRATHDQLVDPSRIRSTVVNHAISSAPNGWFIDCERRPGELVELQFSEGKRRVDVPLGRLGEQRLEVREVVVPVFKR